MPPGQVHKVFPSGLAAQEGTIEKGDEVLSVNGQTLKHLNHADATAILRQARTMKQAVVVICKAGQGEAGAGLSSDSAGGGPDQSRAGKCGGEPELLPNGAELKASLTYIRLL